jgi:hypothetical protein
LMSPRRLETSSADFRLLRGSSPLNERSRDNALRVGPAHRIEIEMGDVGPRADGHGSFHGPRRSVPFRP